MLDFFRDKTDSPCPSEIPATVRKCPPFRNHSITAIEADIYGNVNSTHNGGTKMMTVSAARAIYTQCLYFHLYCLSLWLKKVNQFHRSDEPSGSQWAPVNIVGYRTGVARFAWQKVRPKRWKSTAGNHRKLCTPGLQNKSYGIILKLPVLSQTLTPFKLLWGMHAELAKSGDMKNVNG